MLATSGRYSCSAKTIYSRRGESFKRPFREIPSNSHSVTQQILASKLLSSAYYISVN